MTIGSQLISFLSGEWVLSNGRPNGGDVVVFRTLWVGTGLVATLAFIQATEAPYISVCALLLECWGKALAMLRCPQGPVVYGAVYLALYARFTSQWTYMANLYNQIKQTELTLTIPHQTLTLSQWKAGYIEDAFVTHMATKPTVAGVIRAWYDNSEVKEAFALHTKNHREIIGWLAKNNVI